MAETYAALLPLRGGSKSIPLKNIKMFCGQPLCAWTLHAASATPRISEVWVSTDSDRIAEAVRQISSDIRVHRRPDSLGGDMTTTEAVMLDWIEGAAIGTPHVITLQATSPQTSTQDILAAIDSLERDKADSLVTGIRTHRFFWRDDGTPMNYQPAMRPMRQQWSGTFMENGAFYISRRDRLLAGESRLHGKIALHEMDAFAGIELDEPEDWARLEAEFIRRNMA